MRYDIYIYIYIYTHTSLGAKGLMEVYVWEMVRVIRLRISFLPIIILHMVLNLCKIYFFLSSRERKIKI